MDVLVLGNAQKAGVTEEVERWLPYLRETTNVVAIDLRQESQTLPHADIALVFGGDGAILRAARQMSYHQIPVLGINLGRLGFLADIHPQEFHAAFVEVLAGRYRVTKHLMFECLLEEIGTTNIQTLLGLNELVVHSEPAWHMLDLSLEIDDEGAADFSGDGLIISTPIGSTGHNLSAGGPILEQELSAFVLTPICPHTLTMRPLVESSDKRFCVRLRGNGDRASVIVDGQVTLTIGSTHQVVMRKAPVSFQLVKVSGRGFYQTLRDKLRWAMQSRRPG